MKIVSYIAETRIGNDINQQQVWPFRGIIVTLQRYNKQYEYHGSTQ